MMFGRRDVNIKIVNCPDCGKEFNRKFNMERHRIVIHGNSNREADTEESFDVSDHDEHDISNEQESIADEGVNDGYNYDSDKDEDQGNDDNSSSDSQSSTDDEDDDDIVWSGIGDLSWTSELVDTLDDKILNWWRETCQPVMFIKQLTHVYYRIWDETSPRIIWRKS